MGNNINLERGNPPPLPQKTLKLSPLDSIDGKDFYLVITKKESTIRGK